MHQAQIYLEEDTQIDRDTRACRNLCVAILDRAIADYHGNDRIQKASSFTWVHSDDTEDIPWSFVWICTVLDLDHAVLRHKITDPCSVKISPYRKGTSRKI